jgi:flagellum-specific peptidoglycan hydrolase FlgJ
MATRPKLGNREKQLFIDSVGPLATSSQQRTGVPASVTIAQACLESDWGRSGLSRPPFYNFFGIKARVGEKYCEFKTTEYDKHDVAALIQARFRDFLSIGECFDAHAALLSKSKRYAPAMAAADDPLVFAAKVQQCGYATDPMYADKLARLIAEFNLTRFDVKKQKAVTT